MLSIRSFLHFYCSFLCELHWLSTFDISTASYLTSPVAYNVGAETLDKSDGGDLGTVSSL